MGKKRTKRSKEKFPALKPHLNLKTRYELIDYDYIEQLSEEEKAWLNKFTEEYINASLDRKNLKKNLHKTKKLKKDCDDRNNSRNRCILTRAKAQGKDIDFHGLEHELSGFDEDAMIEKIDSMTDELKDTNNKTAKTDQDDN